ncbi:MAG: ketopantoate reductase family protein [Promethearchaeota archaeon]
MDVVVFGAGSIGSLFAAFLANGGASVSVVARPDHLGAIKKDGLVVEDINGDEKIAVNNINVIEDPKDIYKHDVIFLSVKAFDLESVLLQFKHDGVINTSRHVFVILQNGLGNENIIQKIFPNIPLIRIVTSNGAFLKKPGVVVHTGTGDTYMGVWDDAGREGVHDITNQIAKHLSNSVNDVKITRDISRKTWEKAIINVGINAIGAIFKVKNGDILKNPHLKEISDNLVLEALRVAKLASNIEDHDGIQAVATVLKKTAENKNSMLQDLEHGRKTEIDFINGSISKKGSELGISTPWNDVITKIIHGLESISKH